MRRECRERFPPPPRVSDPDIHHGTCVTHVPWCMSGSLTSGFLGCRRWWKPSRYSRRMRNPQFYVSGKRSMKYTQRYAQYIPRNIYTTVCTVYIPWNIHTVVLCVVLLWLLKSCYSFTQSLTGHCMGSQFQGNSRTSVMENRRLPNHNQARTMHISRRVLSTLNYTGSQGGTPQLHISEGESLKWGIALGHNL